MNRQLKIWSVKRNVKHSNRWPMSDWQSRIWRFTTPRFAPPHTMIERFANMQSLAIVDSKKKLIASVMNGDEKDLSAQVEWHIWFIPTSNVPKTIGYEMHLHFLQWINSVLGAQSHKCPQPELQMRLVWLQKLDVFSNCGLQQSAKRKICILYTLTDQSRSWISNSVPINQQTAYECDPPSHILILHYQLISL